MSDNSGHEYVYLNGADIFGADIFGTAVADALSRRKARTNTLGKQVGVLVIGALREAVNVAGISTEQANVLYRKFSDRLIAGSSLDDKQ
jgi:hypothetical protein